MSATKKPVAFRIRTHAQFERYKQAQGSAMIFALAYPVVEIKFCANLRSWLFEGESGFPGGDWDENNEINLFT